MSAQFDLEQKILQCWSITDDIEALYQQVGGTLDVDHI